MSRGAATKGGGGVEKTKADVETSMVSASTGGGKKNFNLYGCDLTAPRARIDKLRADFPTIGKAIDEWKKARMKDSKLQAKYANLEDFVDFSLSQFLHLTSEFTVTGSDKKIFYRNANFEYDRELRDGFESVIEAITAVIPEDGSNPASQAVVGWWYLYGDRDDQKRAVEFFKVAARRQSNNLTVVRESFVKSFRAGVQSDEAQVAAEAAVKRKRQYDEAQAEYAIIHDSLAMCYQQGIGCEKDVKRAIHFYQLAADQGYVTAQSNLAHLCLNGIGGEKNSSLAILYYSRAVAQGDRKAISSMESTFSNPKIDESSQPLTKDQIIEIINNLAPQTEGERGVRIVNKNSHLIGDLAGVSKGGLEAADLFEIHNCLSRHLTSSGVNPMESKSCQIIRECIAERIKSEIGDESVGEVKFSASHGTALDFSIAPKKVKQEARDGVKTLLLSDVVGVGSTLDEKLQNMHRAEKLIYDQGRRVVTVTQASIKNFSAMSVPARDVGGAVASVVAEGAAVARGGK